MSLDKVRRRTVVVTNPLSSIRAFMALQMHAIRHLRRADHPVSSRLVVEGPGVCGSGLTAALRNGMQVVGYASAESHYLRAKVRDERLAQAPRGLEEGEGEGARARGPGRGGYWLNLSLWFFCADHIVRSQVEILIAELCLRRPRPARTRGRPLMVKVLARLRLHL